jgi:alpha-glucosidase (family GH31 glycosyl hydrolase)
MNEPSQLIFIFLFFLGQAQLAAFHQTVPFDGVWLDMNEPSNFCNGDCSACARGAEEVGGWWGGEGWSRRAAGRRLEVAGEVTGERERAKELGEMQVL